MLSGQVIVVTGGAGLLGSEFVKAIAREGGIAIIADLNEEHGRTLCQDIETEGNTGSADFVSLDITSTSSVLAAITEIASKYGKIDGLVNNAYPRNKNYGRGFFDVDYSDFCENTNLNIGGYFLTSQKFSEFFKNQGHGNIISIASIYGVIAPRFELYNDTNMTVPVEYAVAKSALIHLTKYMAKLLKGTGIRVNSISPGGVLDAQPDSFLDAYSAYCLTKGMLEKSDLVGTLLYLLSDMSKSVNGQNIVVDDGFTI
ncbi:flagellin modification protein A [Oleiphilus messinensis]|uniref:Flagellin modification protein A n=1 Tax=Oleiphilus messinensis TaxID=141451 RepID=A0A1Y0II96_9GAMM|nr:oxidoreductase [Oleiphilus messinensis]ARU59576.1 flagellin modification protein A [Oleiphilus messinensis]